MMTLHYKGEAMYKILLKGLLLSLFMGQGVLMAESCLDKSYSSANVDKDDRKRDLDYSSCIAEGILCCCTSNIISLFKDKTKDITQNRVNPAVDDLIEALRNQRLASDIKIEELVHLKYVNSIYSFYDENEKKMKNEKLNMPLNNHDGCKESIVFRKLTTEDKNRKGVYREGLLKEMLAMLHSWGKSDNMISEKNMLKIVK